MIIKYYLHSDKGSNIWEGEHFGLTGKALEEFKDCCYEVKLLLDLDMTTGKTKIIEVNDVPLTKRVGC